ncbi:Transposase MuDR plant domain-containing protein [Dioscorea alata]|uniref:Transposase MuDR plant domain-containing protein n=1 Tax=Dioscorea alata TaxID=55571 RepID=A0ACB7V186_DIOAL|nr:Transposase MuDR plant domain-containing protein [Dioscorea alata]
MFWFSLPLINNEVGSSSGHQHWRCNEDPITPANEAADNVEFEAPTNDNNDDHNDYYDDSDNEDESSDDDASLPTNVQEDVIAEDAIRTTTSYMEQGENVASHDYTQFEPIPGMTTIDEWYNATEIDDVEPHLSTGDEESLNFNDWVGRIFNSKAQLIDLLSRWSIKKAVTFIHVKCNKSMLTVKCASSNCDWRLHASVSSKTSLWVVKTCPR